MIARIPLVVILVRIFTLTVRTPELVSLGGGQGNVFIDGTTHRNAQFSHPFDIGNVSPINNASTPHLVRAPSIISPLPRSNQESQGSALGV